MWIFTEFGFFSVVAIPNTNNLVVRSRSKYDLEKIIKKYNINTNIITQQYSDYRHRIVISKIIWNRVVVNMTNDINYTNFKSRCLFTLGKFRSDLLSKIWSIMYKVQEVEEIEIELELNFD